MQRYLMRVSIMVVATLSATDPAFAMPQLTGGDADYFLMPFIGYCSIIGAARLLHLRERRNKGR